MILDTKINTVESLGDIQDTQTLTIEKEDIAHIFEMLSSSLYSDSVLTTLTELTSNCYDAHIEAGKQDKPFEICLPTYFSPVFKIKDFGVGMTKEIVEKFYMKLGKSTKRNSNTSIGAFGLGRWAILGVTDSFILRTSRDGIKLTYSIYRGEDGLPNFNLVNEESCADWTGTEVECAVDRSKTNDWTKRIANIVTFYPVIPKVFTDGEEMVIQKPEYFLEEKGEWGILIPNSYSRNNLIICGPTSYPIDAYKIREFINDEKLTNLLNIGVHIYVNLGDVSITPNREGLKYNDKTINLIKQNFEYIQKYIKDYIDKEIAGAKTYFDAIRTASKLKNNSGHIFNCFDIASVKWNGLPLYLDNIPVVLSKKVKYKEKDAAGVEKEKEKDYFFGTYSSYSVGSSSHRKRANSKIVVNRNNVNYFSINLGYYEMNNLENKVVFTENDINESGKNLDARISTIDRSGLLINFNSPSDRAEFFKSNPVLALFKTEKISDFERDKDYLNQFEKNKRTICLVRKFFKRDYYSKDYERWDNEQIDFNSIEGYYVNYYHNKYYPKNANESDRWGAVSARVLNDILSILPKDSEGDNATIYGLTEAQIKKAEKSNNPNFIRLEDYVAKYLKDKYEAYINSYNLNYLSSHIDFEIGNKYEIQEHFTALNELIDELKKNYLNGELNKFIQFRDFYETYIKPKAKDCEFLDEVLDKVEQIRNTLHRKKTVLQTFDIMEFKNLVPCPEIRKTIVDKMLEAV
jgi:hypothetical protein